jgi:HK97 family phage portal protein
MKAIEIKGTPISQITPGWLDLIQDDEARTAASAYAVVPLLYRAVRLRCDALTSIPVRVERNESYVNFPFPQKLSELLWMTEASMLLTGSAFWLKRRNSVQVKELQWINPLTMSVSYENGQIVFSQTINGLVTARWTTDDIVYFKEFSITDDIRPGPSAADVALKNVQILDYLQQFAGQFFKSGAMPALLVTTEGSLNEADRERAQAGFNRLLGGVKNAWRILTLRGNWKTQILTPPVKDLAVPELSLEARRSVSHAFGIPLTMLDDAANYATAESHHSSFWQDTIRPRSQYYEDQINQQLLNPLGYDIDLAIEELDIFQEDEAQRAGAYSSYVAAGMKPSIAAQILGIELPGGYSYEMLDDPSAQDTSVNTQMDDDMKKWERKALKAIAAGKSAAVRFDSEYIPAVLASAISGALEGATNDKSIKAVFADEWRGYP